MIHYKISIENPLTGYIQIHTTVPAPGSEVVYLQLAAWRPGRYELQHFAQKVRNFTVLNDAGVPLPCRKVTKDRWEITANEATGLTIRYHFYARQMDAGGSWIDENQLYVNPVNCLLAVAGKEKDPCELELALPAAWRIACGLPVKNGHILLAENYEHLVDSPFIASATLQQETYEVAGIPFYIWFQGDCRPDWHRIVQDFAAFTREQISLFGDFPATEYHFLNQILPYAHFHGVEHSKSTVITLGPGEMLMTGLYKELLGISSHELFHTWNIKKIRPVEMMPYDYSGENYFRTGYVAEGVTTYYGDYLLARAGVFQAAAYFEELNGVLAKHFGDYGHEHYSVADSSFDLWLDGYKPGTPDRKVSIYHKGALAALILDLEIRRATLNARSLDTVMQRLWQEFGKTGLGYSEADYSRLAEETAGITLGAYFDEVIFGTAPLQPYLEKALSFVGCHLVSQPAGVAESMLGFKSGIKEGRLVVTALAPDSPAAAALALDDELVAVNGRRIDNNSGALLADQGPWELALFRNRLFRWVSLAPNGKTYFPKYLVQKNPAADTQARENFRQWLKQDF